MSKPRGPFHTVGRPGGSFTDAQRKEISAFVSNALNAQAEEILASMAETFRQWHQNYVAYGCLVPDGLERLNAAREAARAARAAMDAKAAESQPPAQEPVASPPAAVAGTIEPPADLTSPLIQ